MEFQPQIFQLQWFHDLMEVFDEAVYFQGALCRRLKGELHSSALQLCSIYSIAMRVCDHGDFIHQTLSQEETRFNNQMTVQDSLEQMV